MKFSKTALIAALMTAPLNVSASAEMDDVEIKTQKLTDQIYVLFGAGGNIGVSAGEDGVFLIDDQYAPLSDKILAAVKAISDKPVKYVINTHYHGDHTGGNENMGRAGAVMVAHDNVRLRLSKPSFIKVFNMRSDAYVGSALPVVTFNDEMSLHLNGEEARLYHIANAHTDGDSIVHFKGSNVIHMGDTMFHGRYPFIDVDAGGSVHGDIKAAALALSKSDDQTKIIPGHGPMTDKAGLIAYKVMLEAARDRVKALKDAGKSLEEVQAAKPMADYDKTITGGGEKWQATFLGFVYNSL